MGEKIAKALKKICLWNYADNEEGNAFTKRVVSHLQKALRVSIRSGSPEINDEIPIGVTIFENPYGTQRSPDIAIIQLEVPLKIIKRTGWIPDDALTIEIKRTEKGKVVWNSGFPTQKRIYLLNTKSFLNKKPISGTTMVLGSDLVSEKDETEIVELKKCLKQLKERWVNIGTFKLGHLRPMFIQNKLEGDWLIHISRKEREEKVFKFAENINKFKK